MQPASTDDGEILGIDLPHAVSRSRLMTTSLPSFEGVAPPTRPVCPPCGTTDRGPVSAQWRTMAATSSVVRGLHHDLGPPA